MRGEADFAAYVAARGTTVVRLLLLLGVPPRDAEQRACEAFATLRSEWAELTRYGDLDVALWADVLSTEQRHRRNAGQPPADPALLATGLRRLAGLEELATCEVLGVPAPTVRALLVRTGPETDARLEEVAEHPVAAPTLDRVAAVVSRRRRHTWSQATVALAVVAAVVGGVVVATRPDRPLRPGDPLPAVAATTRTDATGVVWWADGTLHLPAAEVDVGDLQRVVAAGDGAAYVDGAGRLVAVRPDGSRTLLGRPAPRSTLVSSPRLGLVAWTDVSDPVQPRIVVWDLDADERVAGVVTSARARTITFDGGWLTFGTGLVDWAWDPHGGPARETGNGYDDDPSRRSALVDVVAGTRLEQSGYFLRVARVGSRREAILPGFGGWLSPDGRLVLTAPLAGREPSLFDGRTGAELGAPFPVGWRVRAATFVDRDRVAWLVDRGADGYAIVTCGPDGCAPPVDLDADRTPVLAQDSTR